MTSSDAYSLSTRFDAVVMLTWSNWHTEMRSNRYDYAIRFSKYLPVVFVQPDLLMDDYKYEETDVDNIVILHVYSTYGVEQSGILNKALLSRGIIRPLLWIYNCYFYHFIIDRYAPAKIYHATEDYFNPTFMINPGAEDLQEKLRLVLNHVNLVVAVSGGVKDSYIRKGGYEGELVVLTNGCDFSYWSPRPEELERLISKNIDEGIAFYQGGINHKLDFNLIKEIVTGMPNWQFWFCGEVTSSFKEWNAICKYNNVKFFGKLHVGQVRELAYQASVGVIPFVQNDWIIERSFPRKAFEYVAAGLPVVSVPIKSLQTFPEVFHFAQFPRDFMGHIRTVARTRNDLDAIKKRTEIANKKDIENNFQTLRERLSLPDFPIQETASAQLSVVILFDDKFAAIPMIREHLKSFSLFSKNRVFYLVATDESNAYDFSVFDVAVIHYSVTLRNYLHLSRSCAESLEKFGGLKVLFLLNEKATSEARSKRLEELGVHIAYTSLPERDFEALYPRLQIPCVRYVKTLNGYTQIESRSSEKIRPSSERRIVIGYRYRGSRYSYRTTDKEKMIVAQKMRRICEESGITTDIETECNKGVDDREWHEFVKKCKAILGTVTAETAYEECEAKNGDISTVSETNVDIADPERDKRFLAELEIGMTEIPSEVFEAITHNTALILLEGSYAEILQPNVHYIPLKKDFSDINDVIEKVSSDGSILETVVNKAYTDIVDSGDYSYERIVSEFDKLIREFLSSSKPNKLVLVPLGIQMTPEKYFFSSWHNRLPNAIPTNLPIHFKELRFPNVSPDNFAIHPKDLEISGESASKRNFLEILREVHFGIKVTVAVRLSRFPVMFRMAQIGYRIILMPVRFLMRHIYR